MIDRNYSPNRDRTYRSYDEAFKTPTYATAGWITRPRWHDRLVRHADALGFAVFLFIAGWIARGIYDYLSLAGALR